MAFNSTMAARRRPAARLVVEDQESSFFSDSQTSWVVFNPTDMRAHDILSFSTENPLSGTEGDAESSLGKGKLIEPSPERKTLFERRQDLPLQEPDDELFDGVELTLSNRINEWQKSTDASNVSDNVASWDLDADLIGQVLDTSVLERVPAFYGDTYFRSMSRRDYVRFKKSSAILKQSLTRKGYDTNYPDLIARLLNLIKWRDLLRSSGSLVDDYIANTLSCMHLREREFRDVEFSDAATSSSLVMCGGSGNGSWNDL